MSDWTMAELEHFEQHSLRLAVERGLDLYPQEFEICSEGAMLGYTAYHGMPAHYPHWSYGKSFEKTKTLYDHGITGLPYELVINSDPCLAYLMCDNSRCLQYLTIVHVYGHNDFFKNNFYFAQGTRADLVLDRVKAHADIIREYAEDPTIGAEAVEDFLGAAHALSMHLNRNPSTARRRREEQKNIAYEKALAEHSKLFAHLRGTAQYQEFVPPDLSRVPLEPDDELLLCIQAHNPHLEEWQKVILGIVAEEAAYFLPQIETKIMNEGWASFWHHQLMHQLRPDMDAGDFQEFLIRHNQVVTSHPGSINPYWLGFYLYWYRWWLVAAKNAEKKRDRFMLPDPIIPFDETIRDRVRFREFTENEFRLADSIQHSDPMDELFEIRATARDVSFLQRFLHEDLMRELDLFDYEPRGDNLVVGNVSDPGGWEAVKSTLIQTTGLLSQPKIVVADVNYGDAHGLLLRHQHEGRDMHINYAERTLALIYEHLWYGPVFLETTMKGKPTRFAYSANGFDAKVLQQPGDG